MGVKVINKGLKMSFFNYMVDFFCHLDSIRIQREADAPPSRDGPPSDRTRWGKRRRANDIWKDQFLIHYRHVLFVKIV